MKEENMIPVLGSTLREESELFQKIVKHSSKIYMAMDRDAKTKEKHIAMKLLNYGVEVYKMDTRDHKDVADMPLNIYQEIKSQALQVTHDNFLEYELSF
jgi:putative cell wall-binding protein